MDIAKIPAGEKAPKEVNAVIEVAQNSAPVKYELDKDSGALFVDRFLYTAMFYPCNYGFIPNTLSDDGDPCDILIASQWPVQPGAVLPCRPVGVLIMADEEGEDEKILAVPKAKLDAYYAGVTSYQDLPDNLCQQIAHFFEHYKELEGGKWTRVTGWRDADHARKMIEDALARAHQV